MSAASNPRPALPRPRLLRLGRESFQGGTPIHPQWGERRTLDHPELWFIWAGKCTVAHGGRRHFLNTGDAVLFRPGEPYELRQNPAHPLSVTFFSFDLPAGARSLARLPMVLDHLDFAFCESVSRRIVELYWEAYAAHGWHAGKDSPAPRFTQEEEYVRTGAFCPNPIVLRSPPRTKRDPHVRLAIRLFEAFFHNFVLRARARVPGPAQPDIGRRHRDIVMELAARIRNKPALGWSVAALAREAGYGPDHFARVFRRVVGMSPKRYLLNCRVAEARRLLTESNLTVKEIAARLGYGSAFFFSRQFKDICGVAPRTFHQGPRASARTLT